MKFHPYRSAAAQRGVALVMTLVMLSVVTLMAVAFLALSRRERASVSATEDQTTARLMAEAAFARAQSEIAARGFTAGDPRAVGFFVSTNLVDRAGFNPGAGATGANVNYDHRRDGSPITEIDLLRVISNLYLDARPPVFVRGNVTGSPLEFRFYLDLNRNGRFETNGFLPFMAANNQYLTPAGQPTASLADALFGNLAGDPEWIGVLARPSVFHSPTNRFIGRYAFVVVPEGRTLDINFIHNTARLHRLDLAGLGYYRNQGVGSWELNLAAFLHDLNPNVTPGYAYTGLSAPPVSEAASFARDFLSYRYGGMQAGRRALAPANEWFPGRGSVIAGNFIDDYTDGPPFTAENPIPVDNDEPDEQWPGSDSLNAYFEINDFFDRTKTPTRFLDRLAAVQKNSNVSFDRYTFYRMIQQLGMDSAPANRGRLHLNYDNRLDLRADGGAIKPGTDVGYHTTNLVAWEPVAFFTNAAAGMFASLQAPRAHLQNGIIYTNDFIGDTLVNTGFAINRIMVYPTNEYSPTIHRLLQVALNLYDASTNRSRIYPQLPTVLRPHFLTEGTNVFINGYSELTNIAFLDGYPPNGNLFPLDLRNPRHRDILARRSPDMVSLIYDVPLIIGAKKGFPNFNEYSLMNIAEVTRKLEVRKKMPTDPRPFQTNLLYTLSLSNLFGFEAWNSYTQAFPRALRLQMGGELTVMVTNYAQPGSVLRFVTTAYATNRAFTAGEWRGDQFRVPILRNAIVISNEMFNPSPRPHLDPLLAGTDAPFPANRGFYTPSIGLAMTNRFFYALVDTTAGRLVDFVCFGGMATTLDLTREIAGRPQLPGGGVVTVDPGNMWATNRLGGPSLIYPTQGIENQMEVSLGNIQVGAQQWNNYNGTPGINDKDKGIDRFRVFCDASLTPLVYNTDRDRAQFSSEMRGKLAMQAPFSPTRKLYQELVWQVNDPLVHYMVQDLLDPLNRPNDPNRTNTVRFAIPRGPGATSITNSNLGLLNLRYNPWGGNPQVSTDRQAYNLQVKDPMVTRSDDWNFPTNLYPNIGWIGRVHRGTPWQTIYLKSGMAPTNVWFRWAGSYGTHPTNDWELPALFTTALNDNAARGLLSVNQTNLAAWSAVLAGISVLSNTTPAGVAGSSQVASQNFLVEPDLPGAPQLRTIVAGINHTRQLEVNRVPNGQGRPSFQSMGRLLATPELTVASPYVSGQNLVNDEILERIPQQILSLVQGDPQRYVIYSYGQALKEAPNSVYLGAGDFNQLCTNYQVKAEFVTKSVIRFEGNPSQPRAVVESYNELTSE